MRATTALLIFLVFIAGGCSAPKDGVLVMAHGGDENWNEQVQATVEPLRSKYPTEIAFGMARTSTVRTAIERLERQGVRRIAVVRLFVSGDSFLEPTEYILGLRDSLSPAADAHSAAHHASHMGNESEHSLHTGEHRMEPPEPIDTGCSILLSRAGIAESPLVDEILVDRVRALSTDPARESILILAHGPGDDAENERWLANMRLRAQHIHDVGPFRRVQCETLREDWPGRRAEALQWIRQFVESASKDGGRVIVIPFRVAGFGPYEEVLSGLDYVADGHGFCPHPNLTRWVEETVRACFAGTNVVTR